MPEYREIQRVLTIGDGDTDYDSVVEIGKLMSAANADRDNYETIWRSTVPAQQLWQWGHRFSNGMGGPMRFCALGQKAGVGSVDDPIDGTLQLWVRDSAGIDRSWINEMHTTQLYDPSVTGVDVRKRIGGDQVFQYLLAPMGDVAGEDSILELMFHPDDTYSAYGQDAADFDIFFTLPYTAFIPLRG